MKKPKVVSVDMFGTLADLGSIKRAVWQSFLGEDYTDSLADAHWSRATDLLMSYFEDEITTNGRYVPLRAIFEYCYGTVFDEIGLNLDPAEAAAIVTDHHWRSTPHEDAEPFLSAVGARYPLCLSSDADEDMLPPLAALYRFDQVVISERLESYKSSPDKRFFAEVVRRCDVAPEDIFHIGDGSFDVVGAGGAGIATCWLNRSGRDWTHTVQPDHEVTTLIEAASLLGIEIAGSDG